MSLTFLQASMRPILVAESQAAEDRLAMANRGLYERRESIALITSALIVTSMVYAMNTISMEPPAAKMNPVMVSLVELPETPPPLPPPPELEPRPKQPSPMQAQPQPQPQPQPSVPMPPIPQIETVPPSPAPVPVVEVPPPVLVPMGPPQPPVATPPVPVTMPEAPRSNPAAEGGYQARARALINRNKNYPEEALQMSMTGSVVVVYVIDRGGRLIRAEVDRSSGHSLLDQAALRAVRRTRFEPIPEDAWVALKEQVFRTRIEFNLE